MALELLGSRLLAPVFGNSIFVWGSLIGVVLAALSAGYYLGGRLADRQPDLRTLSVVIFAAGLLVLGLPALAPPMFDLTIRLGLGERYSPLLSTTVLLGPPSILLGMVSPYAIRLAARNVEKIGKASGNLYALSTVGSIVGTFFTVFVLIPTFGVNKIILGLGVTLLVVAFLGLDLRLKVFVLIILMIAPFAAPYMVNHRLTVAAYTLALGDVIYETDTPYHHLVVADSYDPMHQTKIRILILDDNLHSAMDLNNPDRTVFAYTDYFNLGFLLNPNITRVLFIGGGGFTGPKMFLKEYPRVEIDVAEIDAEVIRVAEQYFRVNPSNPRLHVYNEDGRIFLRSTSQKYDLVILDAYSRSYVPFHLMTAEFFHEIANHLTAQGSVTSNLISSISGDSSEILKAETKTMHVAFPNVYTFAVRGTENTDLQNIIILATLLPRPLNETEFEELATTANVGRIPALRDYVANYFTVEPGNAPLLTDDFAPVETLLNPLTGQPLISQEEPARIPQEALRLAAIALIALTVLAVLWRKKLLSNW